jgi:hypothetical protein
LPQKEAVLLVPNQSLRKEKETLVIAQHQGKIAGLQPEMAVHNVGTYNVVGEQ